MMVVLRLFGYFFVWEFHSVVQSSPSDSGVLGPLILVLRTRTTR